MQEYQSIFKDPTELTKWTKRALYAYVMVVVIAIISSALEAQLLSDFKNGVYTSEKLAVAAAEANDDRQGKIGIVQLILFLVSGILSLKWIYRANFNARGLGAINMVFTPGWAIGWYFIPIANLWKPYQAMKEIWKASNNTQNWNIWSAKSVSSLLPWWWFFWLSSGIIGNAAFRMTLRANEIDELLTANAVAQLSNISGIFLSLIFIGILTRIYNMQMSNYNQNF